MIDIDMIYDKLKKKYLKKKFFCSFSTRFYNGMIGNYGQMTNRQVD